MRLLFSYRTDQGLVRPNNQDSFSVDLLDPRGNAALLLVADGMGGYEGGEIASRIAVEIVRDRVLHCAPDWAEKGVLLDGLVQAVNQANAAILRAQQEQPERRSMGTTLTAALIWGQRILIAHVGDSKAVLIRPSGAEKVTTDHNVAGELVESGHLTAEEAAVHPQRHVLTRALGVDANLRIEQRELTWEQGDELLLFTDGLSNLVSLTEIEEISREGFESMPQRLVDLANERGGYDNITVLAARWEG